MGKKLQDPHLLTLMLKNVGPNDIKRDNFDGAKPLEIDLRSSMYGVLQTESNTRTHPELQSDDVHGETSVKLMPSHIPKGAEWVLKVVVSGPARPNVVGGLVDVDTIVGEPTSSTIFSGLAKTLIPWSVTRLLPF